MSPSGNSVETYRIVAIYGVLMACLWLGLGLVSDATANGGPHGNYVATTDSCGACHRPHLTVGAHLIRAASTDEVCLDCHGGTAGALSTHGNRDFSARAEASFQLQCIQCHEPHGSANLAIIKPRPVISTPDGPTTGPVVFTATTGLHSYDSGLGNSASRLCVACHADSSNSGFPMTNHMGGAGHHGGADYSGDDCTLCHRHDADSDPSTVDGFMPVGSCTTCHATTQDNGDGMPAGGRRAVVAEFGYSSHHVQGQVQDGDCLVCHSLTNHAQGVVQLRDVDTGAIYTETTPGAFRATRISLADSKALQPFCLSCHDGDGVAGDTSPFSGGQTVSDVNGGGAWAGSAHSSGAATNTGYGCLGDGATTGCHSTGHGSSLAKLLAPSDGIPGPNNTNQEEGFCYRCHGGAGPAPVDVQSKFASVTRHDVNDDDQAANGARIECIDCHNPHRVTATNPLSNPDNLSQLWSGTDASFCITCHDGSPPAGVAFPPIAAGTGHDKSRYAGSTHSTYLDGFGCRHCHDEHGAAENFLLKAVYARNDPNPYLAADYSLCWQCHIESTVVSKESANAFDKRHYEHVVDNGVAAPCIHCHDVHSPSDSGESGLINLQYGVTRLDIDLTTKDGAMHTLSSAFAISRDGTQGACYLQCHTRGPSNEDHDPKTYGRLSANTVGNLCQSCHPGGPPTPSSALQIVSFQFSEPTGAATVASQPTDGLMAAGNQSGAADLVTGTVHDPADSMPGNGSFRGDGVNNYITFESSPVSLLASGLLTVEARLKPMGISLDATAYEGIIFDRGAGANYRLSVWRTKEWPTYGVPPGVASLAFWVSTPGLQGAPVWKPLLTDYSVCPIVSDHWYQTQVEWNSRKIDGIPGDIFVDDQGTDGAGAEENWAGTINCTHSTQSYLPDALKLRTGAQIIPAAGSFSIGADATTSPGRNFSGLIDWITLKVPDGPGSLLAASGRSRHGVYLPVIVVKARQGGAGLRVYLPVIEEAAVTR